MRCCYSNLQIPDEYSYCLLSKARNWWCCNKKLCNGIETRDRRPPARTLFHSEERITSPWTDSIYYPMSEEHAKTARLPLHVPRVLGFPLVCRLRTVASLCKTVTVEKWFWQLDSQLSTGKWLGCHSCYAKGEKALPDNHCHWFLYQCFFQFTQYFNFEIVTAYFLSEKKC